MRLTTFFSLGLAAALTIGATDFAEAKRLKPSTTKCSVVAKQLKKRKLHYAYAENKRDRRGGFACGTAWGNRTKAEAQKIALKFCNREERIPPVIGRRGTCRVIFSK